jgi:hypothetical protein
MCIPAKGSTPIPGDLQLVPADSLPPHASWYSVRRWGHYPPSPFNWCHGRDDVLYYRSPSFGTNRIIIDDSTVNYPLQPTTPGPSYGSGDDTGPWPRYNSNDFYLEISLNPNQTGFVDVTAHGLISNYFCQLLTNADLSTDPVWVPGPYFQNSAPTNEFTFEQIPARNPAQDFFRGVQLQANYVAYVLGGGEASEPSPTGWFSGQDAYFEINLPVDLSDGPLTVYYTLSGTAINGEDYTNLAGFVTIPNSNHNAQVWIHPINDNVLDFDETVVLTLIPTNGYVANPTASQASIVIHDDPFIPVAIVDGPSAVDFSSPTESLIISANLTYNTYNLVLTNNFLRLATNGTFTTWSGISGLFDEVKIATVRTTTNRFIQGEMFFSTDEPGVIGRVSADATTWTNNWVTLEGETNHIRGGLCFDTTGVWNYDLIAVTGEGQTRPGSRSVWRIHSPTNYTRVAVVTNVGQLEGVTCVPNDPNYGPWAGKILTGDEYSSEIYTIDTNGAVTIFDTFAILPNEGIGLSDVDIVPRYEDLYCTLQQPNSLDQGLLIKIPSTFMTNNIGEVVITQSGEVIPNSPIGSLFFLRWDASKTNFIAKKVLAAPAPIRILEHGAFAPLHLPALTP